MTERRLQGRVAIITGGAQGIGRSMALRFASEGCDVIIIDLLENLLAKTEPEIAALGVRTGARKVDISDVEATQELVDWAVLTFGRLDILVNNAAVRQGPTFFDVSEEIWDRFFAVNARGTFFLTRAAGRVMAQAGWGRIINISSIAARGWWGAPCPPYSGSKLAKINIARVAALNLSPHNVTINTICPGLTRTAVYLGMAGKAAEKEGVSLEVALDRIDRGRMIPIGRSNEPEDIANLAAFLVSEEARNITGQTFNVDGGLVFESGVSQPSDYSRSTTLPLRTS